MSQTTIIITSADVVQFLEQHRSELFTLYRLIEEEEDHDDERSEIMRRIACIEVLLSSQARPVHSVTH